MAKALVHGVGINDANYRVCPRLGKERSVCPFYSTWKGMLRRCYSTAEQKRYPNYIGCTVVKDWHTFSNFKAWMEKQDWQSKQLDKDILESGNKIYSPEKCAFVDSMTNSFVLENCSRRGDLPIGVTLHKKSGMYQAQCKNPLEKDCGYIGIFKTADEAHYAWKVKKHEVANKLASLQTDKRVAAALISKYKLNATECAA